MQGKKSIPIRDGLKALFGAVLLTCYVWWLEWESDGTRIVSCVVTIASRSFISLNLISPLQELTALLFELNRHFQGESLETLVGRQVKSRLV